jgi:carbon monoxide dehydrogenase subunit G
MKVLKIILIAILVLIVLFFLTGVFVPTVTYNNSALVKASPEKCWGVLHDTSRMSRWMEGFKSLKLQSGRHMEAGSTYQIIIEQGERMVMQEKLKEIRENEFVAFELTNDMLKSEFSYTLEPAEGGTQITTQYEVTAKNLLWKSVFALSKSYFKESDKKMLEGLKETIEQ